MVVGGPTGGTGLGVSLRRSLEMIRFSHSVFALPFALFSLFLAADGVPPGSVLAWVVVAMVAARSAALGVNRLADRRFDAENPRTAGRHLVTGSVSVPFAAGFTVVSALVFLGAAWALNETAFLLAPFVLLVLFAYSFLKRFTTLAHFGVGLALGLSPLGAWVAGAGGLRGDLALPLVLGLGVLTWVAGFDVIYACQDVDVDRRLGLHSIPARWGVARALRSATALHLVCLLCFAAVGERADLGWIYRGAVAAVALLLLAEHAVVRPSNLARVNLAFFTLNGIVSLVLGAAGIVSVLL
ncbi:MAG: 4-hydroxybenzoate octaprenyltransferase [Planctomycetota bacterium]